MNNIVLPKNGDTWTDVWSDGSEFTWTITDIPVATITNVVKGTTYGDWFQIGDTKSFRFKEFEELRRNLIMCGTPVEGVDVILYDIINLKTECPANCENCICNKNS